MSPTTSSNSKSKQREPADWTKYSREQRSKAAREKKQRFQSLITNYFGYVDEISKLINYNKSLQQRVEHLNPGKELNLSKNVTTFLNILNDCSKKCQ